MARKGSFGKIVLEILIILILIAGGLLWFHFLGLPAKTWVNDVVSKITGKQVQTSQTVTKSNPLVTNLDEDRLNKQREANEIFKEELDKREADIITLENQHAQVAAELEEREKNQEEREKTFNLTVKKYDDRNVNIEQIASNLNGMRPQAAVDILVAMDDQTVIDVLRKVEEMAAANGKSSMGSYWLSLMPSERAAEIQRKMLSKPENLD
jgi:flagellar protein FlbB